MSRNLVRSLFWWSPSNFPLLGSTWWGVRSSNITFRASSCLLFALACSLTTWVSRFISNPSSRITLSRPRFSRGSFLFVVDSGCCSFSSLVVSARSLSCINVVQIVTIWRGFGVVSRNEIPLQTPLTRSGRAKDSKVKLYVLLFIWDTIWRP